MKNKKIAIDIDNVCLNFSRHFIDYLGFDNIAMPTNYRDSRFVDYFKLVENDELFWSSIPVLDVPKFDFDCYITSRPLNDSVNTFENMKALGFPSHPIITVGLNKSKLSTILERDIDFMVDDSVEHFLEINSAILPDGVKKPLCFLYSSSHNMEHKTTLRVESLEQFYEIVKRMQ